MTQYLRGFGICVQPQTYVSACPPHCSSHDVGQPPIHLFSAFADAAAIVIGQFKTCEKSNEITVIPEPLEWVDVRIAIVTNDLHFNW